MRKTICRVCLAGIGAAALFAAALLSSPAAANTLSTDIIGMFPKDMSEFAYADLKEARKHPWFAQLQEQMLPSHFRQFEQFLRSAGIDPDSQVDELAWGAVTPRSQRGQEIVGVALGEFTPNATEQRFKQQKLPEIDIRGYHLYAFGSGAGPNDIFFFFLDDNTAAFGQRGVLEQLISVRFGSGESLLNNNSLFPLINEANGNGMIWAVLDQTNTRLALHQLLPQADQFPQASAIVDRIHAMEINIKADEGVDARFQAVCATPDDANELAAMLQGGLVLRRYQVQQTNPDFAQTLSNVTVTPSGDRIIVDAPVSDDQLAALIRSRTFAATM